MQWVKIGVFAFRLKVSLIQQKFIVFNNKIKLKLNRLSNKLEKYDGMLWVGCVEIWYSDVFASAYWKHCWLESSLAKAVKFK